MELKTQGFFCIFTLTKRNNMNIEQQKYLGLSPIEFFNKVKDITLSSEESKVEQEHCIDLALNYMSPQEGSLNPLQHAGAEIMSYTISRMLGLKLDTKTYEVLPNFLNFNDMLCILLFERYEDTQEIWLPIAEEITNYFIKNSSSN